MNEHENGSTATLDDLAPDYQIAWYLQNALQLMEQYKPNVRPEVARRWAIVITELEKVIAWWDYHICRTDTEPVDTSDDNG